MSDNHLSLYFELAPGQKADLEIISSAAIAWVETMRAAARAIDPDSDIKVELVDADESSLIYNTIINWFGRTVQSNIERVKKGQESTPERKNWL